MLGPDRYVVLFGHNVVINIREQENYDIWYIIKYLWQRYLMEVWFLTIKQTLFQTVHRTVNTSLISYKIVDHPLLDKPGNYTILNH